ncbi:MAG TPA: putative quinol monooxygenase [Kofleriaceae bacterium]|jgi:quinol monooxygenase YgiN
MKLLISLVLLTACGSTPSAHHPEDAMTDKTLRGHGDSSTVAMHITMKIKPEFEQAFVDFAADVVKKTYDEEPGVLTYTMYKHPTEPSTYVFIERYRDAAAYETHMGKPYMAEAMEKLPTWLAAPPVEEKYTQLLPR